MSPPNEAGPRLETEGAADDIAGGDNLKPTSTPARARFDSPAVYRRRRWQHQHDALHGRTYPTCPSEPSTFLLEPGELRREGNRLHASGWKRDEIVQVLDVEPVVK